MRTRAVVAVLGAVVITMAGLGPGPALAMNDPSKPTPAVEPDPAVQSDTDAGQLLAAPGYKILWGVNAEARDEVFAVGVGGSDDLLVRARRFDGHRWALDQPPGAPPSDFRSATPLLEDGTAWAVGNTRERALIGRWDGTAWTQVPTPAPEPGQSDFLKSVDAAGPNDIWAVGVTYTDYPFGTVPLAMHWDGTEWSKVDIPLPVGHDSGILNGITAVSGDDVWVAGGSAGPLLIHWDGHEWIPYTRTLEDSLWLRGIDSVAGDDIWAVGSDSSPPREWGLLHWNGEKWREFHAPVPPGDWVGFVMLGVTAIGPDDVWAVGGYGNRPDTEHAQTLHWNGHKWRRVKSPQPGDDENTLYGVSGRGPDDVYAVGTFETNDNDAGKHHLIQHWDGDRWTRVHPKRD